MRALPWVLVLTVVVAGCQSAGEPPAPQPSAPAASEPQPTPPPAPPAATTQPKPPEPTPAPEATPRSMSTADAQKRLAELGYKPGPADGVAGPRTVAAIKRFQRDRKLAQTGTLDAETVAELQKPKR